MIGCLMPSNSCNEGFCALINFRSLQIGDKKIKFSSTVIVELRSAYRNYTNITKTTMRAY